MSIQVTRALNPNEWFKSSYGFISTREWCGREVLRLGKAHIPASVEKDKYDPTMIAVVRNDREHKKGQK